MNLKEKLRAAGLEVRTDPGWETNTNSGKDRIETVAILNHWDAIRGEPSLDFYMSGNDYGGIIYGIIVRRLGLVDLISQRYVWHAGNGDSQVLKAHQMGLTPPEPRPGVLDENGNPHFYGVAVNYHPHYDPPLMGGNPQYEALVIVNRVLKDHFDLEIEQISDHAGWKSKKWDIDPLDMRQFHADILDEDLVPTPTPPPPDWTQELIMSLPTLKLYDGYTSKGTQAKRPHVKTAQGLLLARGYKDRRSVDPETASDGWFGPGTEASVKSFQRDNGLTVDGIIGRNTWTKLLLQ